MYTENDGGCGGGDGGGGSGNSDEYTPSNEDISAGVFLCHT
jgi:hypothetical protein